MHVGKILSELRKQRGRIDRAIAAVEMLKPQPSGQTKQATNRRKSKSEKEVSRDIYALSTEKDTLATEKVGSRARVIPFGRLRRRA